MTDARARSGDDAARTLAAIVESSDDAIIAKDLDGTILSWNRGAERMYGYAAAEAIGRPIYLIVPPPLVDELSAILERIRAGERVRNFETVRATKDGRLIDVALSISPIRDAAGHHRRRVGHRPGYHRATAGAAGAERQRSPAAIGSRVGG